MALPWDTGRTFRVFSYGAGHSQLTLRSERGSDDGVFMILFEAVEFVRLHMKYPQAVFRLASASEEAEFGHLPGARSLRIAVSSPMNTGLIACWKMTVRQGGSPDDYRDEGDVVMRLRADGH